MQPVSYSPAMTYAQPTAQRKVKTSFGSTINTPAIDKTQAYGQARELVQDAAHAIRDGEAILDSSQPHKVSYASSGGTTVVLDNSYSSAHLKISQETKNLTVTFETSGPQLPAVTDFSGFIYSSDGSCIASTNNDPDGEFPFNKSHYQGLIDLINDKNPEVIKASKAVRHPSHKTKLQKLIRLVGDVTGFNAWWNG